MPEIFADHPSAEQLSAFAMGKLSAELTTFVAAHLDGCPNCQEKADLLPPDSFVASLKASAPRTDTVLPSASSTASHQSSVGRSKASVSSEVPAELAASNKYEVLGKLGEGGMGAVWKARHAFLDCLVAIKVMNQAVCGDPDVQARFLREMRAAGKLKHRHIVHAYDAEQMGQLLLLVMEYVEGINLDQLVAQKGWLRIDFACRLIAQAAEGLQHAHERGMVHRDVKPANLMITKAEREVKILDFGLARLARDQAGNGAQTQFQTFMGTPEYVAPEQATDARNVDIRGDVYSLGCTLYFLLAGRPPFRGDTALNVLLSHVEDEALPLPELRPEVPEALWAVVAKMIAKAPGNRYQTPGEVTQALTPFVTAERKGAGSVTDLRTPLPSPSRLSPPPLPTKTQRCWPVRRRYLGAGAVALVMMAVLAFLVLHDKPKTSSPAAPADGPGEGFVSLFNGKDLTGWKVHPKGVGQWEVRGHILTGRGKANYLFSERSDIENFRLRVEARSNERGNSGLFFRCPFTTGVPPGLEVEITEPTSAHKTGSVYEKRDKREKWLRHAFSRGDLMRADEWFTLEVHAQGSHVRSFVNGRPAAEVWLPAASPTRGHLALQQMGSGIIEYRKIELQELRGGEAKDQAPPGAYAQADPADPRGKWTMYQVGQHFRSILWCDEAGWHFRSTQHKNSNLTHPVAGVITAIDGEVRDLVTRFPKGFVPSGSAKVTADKGRVVFNYLTKGRGGEAGFDFKLSPGCRLLRCAIVLDEWHPPAGVHIGAAGVNPKGPVFTLKIPKID